MRGAEMRADVTHDGEGTERERERERVNSQATPRGAPNFRLKTQLGMRPNNPHHHFTPSTLYRQRSLSKGRHSEKGLSIAHDFGCARCEDAVLAMDGKLFHLYHFASHQFSSPAHHRRGQTDLSSRNADRVGHGDENEEADGRNGMWDVQGCPRTEIWSKAKYSCDP